MQIHHINIMYDLFQIFVLILIMLKMWNFFMTPHRMYTILPSLVTDEVQVDVFSFLFLFFSLHYMDWSPCYLLHYFPLSLLALRSCQLLFFNALQQLSQRQMRLGVKNKTLGLVSWQVMWHPQCWWFFFPRQVFHSFIIYFIQASNSKL